MSRALVLGNSGFVGTWLSRSLAQSKIETRGFSSKDLDLVQPESAARLEAELRTDDTLVVISALTPDRGRDVSTMVKNVRMIETVCTVLAKKPCAYVLYVSSDAVYADDAHPVRETSCCSPSTLHGVMHFARERMLQHVCGTSMPLLLARPCAIYGAGDTHNSYGPNRFIRTAASSGAIQLFGEGEEQRDHVHAGDVADLLCKCIEQRITGPLNIATGAAVSFGDAARLVAEVTGRPVTVQGAPRQGPITHRHFDTTALMRTFPGFRFRSLRDGLAQTMKETHA